MRIQKYLALKTPYSRRQIEKLIDAKKIQVNGQYAQLGQSIKDGDQISLEKNTIRVVMSQYHEEKVLMLNKPLGVICSKKDEKDRPSVYDLLPDEIAEKWFMVGRLDINTTGLMLFCSNGDLANQLMHPRYGLIRTYHVRVYGHVKDEDLKKLERGVISNGETLRCLSCLPLEYKESTSAMNHWVEMKVKTGYNRMIRRMWETLGMQVSRLVRVSYGSVRLPENLRLGEVRLLDTKAMEWLKKDIKN